MDTDAWLTVAGIAAAAMLALLSGGSSIAVAIVGWFMKRSVHSADNRLESMDDKLSCLPDIQTGLAVLTERSVTHGKRLDSHSMKLEELIKGKP